MSESSLGCIFILYLLHLDDAGSPANAAKEYFVLGGICVFEAQVDWFGREVDKLAAGDVEFLTSIMFSRREDGEFETEKKNSFAFSHMDSPGLACPSDPILKSSVAAAEIVQCRGL